MVLFCFLLVLLGFLVVKVGEDPMVVVLVVVLVGGVPAGSVAMMMMGGEGSGVECSAWAVVGVLVVLVGWLVVGVVGADVAEVEVLVVWSVVVMGTGLSVGG